MSTFDDVLKVGPVLLYDGSCGVCNRTVQWVLTHERSDSALRFAALESPVGLGFRKAALVPADVDSLIWIEAGEGGIEALWRTSALLRLAREARGAWALLGILRFVPRTIRDFFYGAFARVRHSVAAPTCFVPRPNQKARFLTTIEDAAPSTAQ